MEEDEMDNMTPEQIAKAQRDNCIFCKIIAGDIPSKKIYEDPDFVGILDINPAADGHVLLLPKKHFQIMPQIPPDIVGSMGVACANISAKIINSFKCEGTSIFIANGAIAGQRAPHFMVHIIPRLENDDIELNPGLKKIDDSSFNAIRNKIASAMGINAHVGKTPNERQNKEQEEKEEKEESEENEEQEDKTDSQENQPSKDNSKKIDYDKLSRLLG